MPPKTDEKKEKIDLESTLKKWQQTTEHKHHETSIKAIPKHILNQNVGNIHTLGPVLINNGHHNKNNQTKRNYRSQKYKGE